jgi:hypothetical protein
MRLSFRRRQITGPQSAIPVANSADEIDPIEVSQLNLHPVLNSLL